MRMLLVTLTMCLCALPVNARYSGGTGEPNDPYQVATAADLIALGQTPEDYDKHFILTADIDLDPNLPGGKVFDKAVIAPETDQEAISRREGTPFTGVFDGNDRSICHLTVMGTSCLGLFGHLDGAEVRCVRLIDPNVDGSYYVGALAGWLEDGAIVDCNVTSGFVAADSTVGGLVGCHYTGNITGCRTTDTLIAAGNGTVGGLVGTQVGGNISNCSVRGGSVTGTVVAGGLVGRGPWQGGSIGHSFVQDARIQAYDPLRIGSIGGVVGWAGKCTISECHVTGGSVRGGGEVGGIIGLIDGGTIIGCYTATRVEANGGEQRYAPCLVAGGLAGLNAGTIENCYSTSSVSQGEITVGRDPHLLEGAGGLVGCNRGTIDRSYATGSVVGTVHVGGLVGDNVDGSVTGCVWDMQASGQPTSAGGTGKTTAEMQTASTFLEAAWDFLDETANGAEDVWWMEEGAGYPRLWWEPRETKRLPVVELDVASFDAGIAQGVVLVDFYATWCSHCTTQMPILEEVADRLEGRAQVAKFDVDLARSIAQQCGVKAIPTLLLFRDGVEVERFIGVTSADVLVAAILAAVNSLPGK